MNVKYFLTPVMLFILSLAGNAQERDNRIFEEPVLKISEVKTNTIRSDFGPAVVMDSLYFTSYSDKILGQPDTKLRKSAFYDLYRAKIDTNGNTISKREPISEFLTKYHDGPVSFCERTGELFVTQSDNIAAAEATKRATQDTIRLRIVIAKQVKGKWASIVNFPYNNPAYSVGHPAISVTGDTLIFSCDKKGGFGETDLYYSVRNNGMWGLPVNMGDKINTSGKEEFPFITHNKSGGSFLVFSSTGRFGYGGLDLFYTIFSVDNFKAGHFEAPINTPSDDFGMVIPPDAEYGYLTSNRPGTGNDDIYKFDFKKILRPSKENMFPVKELYLFNRKTGNPISGGLIRSCDKQVYLSDQRGEVDMLTKITGNCEVFASKIGYRDVSKILVAKIVKKGEVNRDTIWMQPAIGTAITLKNIYYDYDKWDILPEAAKELDVLISFMNENPGLNVFLTSHTDSRGNDLYNLKLSQRRAESAVNYIVSHGITSGRISGVGLGETQLLNRCANGVTCTPQEHRQNRRTEIFIPEFGKAKDVPQTEGQYSGKEEPVKPLPEIETKAKSEAKNKVAPVKETKSVSTVVKKDTLKAKIPAAPSIRSKNTQKKEAKPLEKSITPAKVATSVPVIETKQVNTKSPQKYFLILRSLDTKARAEKWVRKHNVDLNGIQILGENAPFRMGYYYASFKEAREARNKFLEKYPDCWIFRMDAK
jgi:outer membrane protein OmpA-like peptidoglycan-associated protein